MHPNPYESEFPEVVMGIRGEDGEIRAYCPKCGPPYELDFDSWDWNDSLQCDECDEVWDIIQIADDSPEGATLAGSKAGDSPEGAEGGGLLDDLLSDMELIQEIKEDEGFEPNPYLDSLGQATIGFGRLMDRGISRDEAEVMLKNDLKWAVEAADKYPWFRIMSRPRQRAVINMIYNLGAYRFSTFKKMITALQAGNYELAAEEALDSLWAKQVGRRADRIAHKIRMG